MVLSLHVKILVQELDFVLLGSHSSSLQMDGTDHRAGYNTQLLFCAVLCCILNFPPPPGNLYWTDQVVQTVEVSRLNGSNRYVVVHGDMEKPRSIVVHPARG